MFNETYDDLLLDFETSDSFTDYLAMQQDTYSWIDDETDSIWSNIDSQEDSTWSDSMPFTDSDGDTKMDLRVSTSELKYDGLGDIYANVQRDDLGMTRKTQMANGRVSVLILPAPLMPKYRIMTSREFQEKQSEIIFDNFKNKN